MAFEILPLDAVARQMEFNPEINKAAALYRRAHRIKLSKYFHYEIIRREMTESNTIMNWSGVPSSGKSSGALSTSEFRMRITLIVKKNTDYVFKGKRYIYWGFNRTKMLRQMRKLEQKGEEYIRNTTWNLDETPEHFGSESKREQADYNNIIKMVRAYQISFNHITPEVHEWAVQNFRIQSLTEFDRGIMKAKHLLLLKVGEKFVPAGFIYTKMPSPWLWDPYYEDKLENIGREIAGHGAQRHIDFENAARGIMKSLEYRQARNDDLRIFYVEKMFGTAFTKGGHKKINKLALKMIATENIELTKKAKPKLKKLLEGKTNRGYRGDPNDPKNIRILQLLDKKPRPTYDTIGKDPRVAMTAAAVCMRIKELRKVLKLRKK